MFLKFSHDYKIDIDIDGNTYTKEFTTIPDPIYVPFNMIENSGYYKMISDVEKHIIVYSLHENSVRAENIAKEYDNKWWDKDKDNEKYEEMPYYVAEYVMLKTIYDLVKYNMYGSNQQIESASLADFEFETRDMDGIEPVLDNLRERIDELLDLVKGLTNRGVAEPKTFVPGEKSDPYPLRPRTVRSYKPFYKRNYEKRKNILLRRNPFF